MEPCCLPRRFSDGDGVMFRYYSDRDITGTSPGYHRDILQYAWAHPALWNYFDTALVKMENTGLVSLIRIVVNIISVKRLGCFFIKDTHLF